MLCRFRGQLMAHGLSEKLFAEINRQLAAQGLMRKSGTLIDATLVEASVGRPPASEGEVSPQDPEAGFTRRGSKSVFGFKAHIAVDQGSELVRQAVLTSADVPKTLVADALIQGDERAVFADKAYDSERRRQALAEAGIADGIMHRSRSRQTLRSWQRWRNIVLAPIRAAVERVLPPCGRCLRLGTLKRSYGWWRARYRGLDRNEAHLHLLCTAYNLRRAAGLTAT